MSFGSINSEKIDEVDFGEEGKLANSKNFRLVKMCNYYIAMKI